MHSKLLFGAGDVYMQPLPLCHTLEKSYSEAFKLLYAGRLGGCLSSS